MIGNPRQSWILDSKLWIPDFFCQWNSDSGFLELNSGFHNSGISGLPYMER